MTKVTRIFLATLLLTFIIGCSKVDDASISKEAHQKIQEGKFLEALNDFQKIVTEYPNSPFIVSAKFEMGKLYQGNVIPNISRVESFKKSVDLYTDIYTNFPDSAQAVNALFMTGFLQANELQDLDAARETYNQFIMKYPNHELAVSAKAELDNLGKTPEQILQEKMNGIK